MSNVVLVFEKPKTCSECICFASLYSGVYCKVADKKIEYNYKNFKYTKPNWCPLKEVVEN